MEFEEQQEEADQTSHELPHSHPPPSYDSLTLTNNNNINNNGNSSAFQARISPLMQLDSPAPGRKPCRYRECLKNHAVGLGGHALDGCCEFMPAGDEGTLDALKCAACNCHRNFHRKEINPNFPLSPHHLQQHQHQHFVPYYRSPSGYLHVTTPTSQRPLALPSSSGGGMSSQEQEENMTSSGGLLRKRHRTKFTPEQKEKMVSLAERLGWRIQKEDDEAVKCFCEETGVSRHVLKVWMHNNKHTLGKKP